MTTRLRTIAGHGAALAVLPYLLIKIAWTLGVLLPTPAMAAGSWRAINALTAVLAAVGILLALAFCRPWGERLPAGIIAVPMWVGTGLLVPMVLLAPVLGPAAVFRDAQAGSADLWAYEQIFIMISLVGVGVGLPVALAGYVRARWPQVSGPLAERTQPSSSHTGSLQRSLGGLAASGAVLLASIRIYWAAGGTVGLSPSTQGARDLWWHLLSLSTGVWALAGAWAVLVLATRRGARRVLPPPATAWVASGMLFAYSLYALLLHSDATHPTPEHPVAHALTTQAGIILGLLIGIVILLVLHERRPRMPDTALAVRQPSSWDAPARSCPGERCSSR